MRTEEILDKDKIRIWRITSNKVDDFGLIIMEEGDLTFYTEVSNLDHIEEETTEHIKRHIETLDQLLGIQAEIKETKKLLEGLEGKLKRRVGKK